MSKPWAIYARVSTKRQVDDGLSIEAQLEQLRAFAKQRGYDVREFVDRGKSAWRDDLNKRPAFKGMLDDARNGELAGVIVTHLDRFSRNLLITLATIGELGKLQLGFISLENSAFDFSRPADRLLMAVLGAFAEYYSNELSRKIKRGLAHRAAQGYHNGLIAFGYCNGKCVDCNHDNPTCSRWRTSAKDDIVLHPDDAPGVMLAFETYRQKNVSFDGLADVLNAAGYRSRTPEGRTLFNKHSIAEMLRNITYTGIVIHKGNEIPGKFPAIISREVFDEVQSIKAKKRFKPKTYSSKYRVYIFGGIIHCAGCGRIMRAQDRGGSTSQCYHCTSNELKHTTCQYPSAWIPERLLADQFAQIVAQFKLPEDLLARVNELLNANGKSNKDGADKTTLTERLARLKKQYEWGDIDEREYLIKRDEIKHALADCEPPATRAIIDAAKYLQNMAQLWNQATQDEQRDMVRAILDGVACDPEQRQLVELQPKPIFRPLFRQMNGLIAHGERFEIKLG